MAIQFNRQQLLPSGEVGVTDAVPLGNFIKHAAWLNCEERANDDGVSPRRTVPIKISRAINVTDRNLTYPFGRNHEPFANGSLNSPNLYVRSPLEYTRGTMHLLVRSTFFGAHPRRSGSILFSFDTGLLQSAW
jgi:hypothetical protein